VRRSDTGFLRVRDGIAGVLADLSESLAGVRVVSSYNRQPRNVVSHRNVVGTYRDANDHTAHLSATYSSGTEMLGYGGPGAGAAHRRPDGARRQPERR
jgi:ATP-binding cassette subfamily B protein